MKCIDPGHLYDLDCLDVGLRSERVGHAERLRFVKRIGDKFPGNRMPGYSGTTTQEVIRALIDRTKYVNGQRENQVNLKVIRDLRSAFVELEMPPGIKVCSAQQRRRTPPAFAAWLVDLAARAIPAASRNHTTEGR